MDDEGDVTTSSEGNERQAARTYHVGLGALRHVHDLDGDDLAAERAAPRAAHDGGGAVPDGLEQLVVRRADGELPLPPPPRQRAALLPLPHAAALRAYLQGLGGGVTRPAPARIKNHHAQGKGSNPADRLFLYISAHAAAGRAM